MWDSDYVFPHYQKSILRVQIYFISRITLKWWKVHLSTLLTHLFNSFDFFIYQGSKSTKHEYKLSCPSALLKYQWFKCVGISIKFKKCPRVLSTSIPEFLRASFSIRLLQQSLYYNVFFLLISQNHKVSLLNKCEIFSFSLALLWCLSRLLNF